MNFNANTFRALSSPTRLRIIKSLNSRRKTQSELASELNMHVSTIKEHLDKLETANLVILQDEGNKWKYYSITSSAKNILFSTELSIVIPAGLLFVFMGVKRTPYYYGSSVSDTLMKTGNSMPEISQQIAPLSETVVQTTPDYMSYFLIGLGALVLLYALYRLITRKRKL